MSGTLARAGTAPPDGRAGHGASLWAATARAAPDLSHLAESRRADVLVIGGGLTGLSTALHLAEAGASVTLLEAQVPGQGGSGRNGGQVIPGLKDDPEALDALYGPAATDFAGRTADILFDLIARHGIACDAQRDGWIQAAMKKSHLPMLERRMSEWAARGAPVEWLDAAEMARQTGSTAFVGGWRDLRAGRVHPLDLVHGMAEAALRCGAAIFRDSPVIQLQKAGALWQARAACGAEVRAEQVVIATNAYTPSGLWPKIEATLLPANSVQVATEPLPAGPCERIMPQRSVVSESRRVGTYFRIGPGNRLMLGARGPFTAPKGPADFATAERELRSLFPQVADIGIAYRWSGRVGMTSDHRPRLFQPAPGLTVAMGYNGRGVALGTALGKALAAHLVAGADLPFPSRPVDPLPLHALHRLYGAAAVQYFRLRDRLDR